MKLCEIPYEVALQRHPTQVRDILARLRVGTSKHKRAEPEKLTWSYECGVLISQEIRTLADVMAGKFEEPPPEMTIDERVADQVRRTRTTLYARIGHWNGVQHVDNPPEVAALARQHIATEMRDDAAYKALPQEEKDRRAAEALAELRGTPGFMELRVQRRR